MVPADPDPAGRDAAALQREDRLVKWVLAIVVLATGLSGVAVWISSARSDAQFYAESISADAQRDRAERFDALRTFPLALVSAADMPKAIDSMHLPPLAARIPATRSAALRAGSIDATDATDATDSTEPAARSVVLQPAAQRVRDGRREQLAWITLWDSDQEGGDAVEIDSGGYSRTVTLTTEGVTFAIPIPDNGKIRFEGRRDGDGGGITVGVASGAAVLLLPIMRSGEALALNVKAG